MSGKGKGKRVHGGGQVCDGNILSPRFGSSPETVETVRNSSGSPMSLEGASDDTPWSDSGASSSDHVYGPYGDVCDDSGANGAGNSRRHGGGASEELCWSPVIGQAGPASGAGVGTDQLEAGDGEQEQDGEGWGADGEDGDDESRDGFLDDFAKELDDSSCDEQEEGAERGRGVCGGGSADEAVDARVACALQEEEWRRSPPPLSSSPSEKGPVLSTGLANGSSRGSSSSPVRYPAVQATETGDGGILSPAAVVACTGNSVGLRRGSNGSGAPLRRSRAAAWPPGGIKEGEGLPLNELPDEILNKVAAFALLPRCVSKRIQLIRVKIVRKRVILALESSVKLPMERAEQVEEAIFTLFGRFVGKAYNAKARELSFNLRIGKNDPLRERLLSGSLPPGVLVRMSSDQLAPLAVRQEKARIARKRIREVTASRDSPNHTITKRFTCPECNHERTQYRTWRRKAVVDRVRVIVQCLQCRHSWEL